MEKAVIKVPILNSPGFANFISAYMGTVVGASGAIYMVSL
jgi:hypothetical protein